MPCSWACLMLGLGSCMEETEVEWRRAECLMDLRLSFERFPLAT